MPLSPPHLSDKLTDWHLIEVAGGQGIFDGKDVIDFGPSYGLDLFAWSFFTRSYTVVESAPDVLAHVRAIKKLVPERDIAIVEHNLQNPMSFDPESFDVVIDFGTIDNVIAGVKPYLEALRLLRVGGLLLTTFANYDHFKIPLSDCGDEYRWKPDDLIAIFKDNGGQKQIGIALDQPRAGLVIKKVGDLT